MSHSPPPLPRQDFHLEPNPFEQSFSARSEPSNVRSLKHPSPVSSDSSRSDRSLSKKNSSPPPRPLLPPLASISSPADQSYSWPFSSNAPGNSLRSGPLSPAMLQGPQPNNSSDLAHLQFDPASFRSGLTPRSGMTPRTGLTPGTGLTPLVGSSAPFPPSPNTAAFLAIMNNSNSTAPSSGVTITPNTLNAISSVLNPGPTQHHYQPSHLQHSTTQNSSHENDSSYIQSAPNATSTAPNGLFLLSQAHQELKKREEAQARAGANGSAHGKPVTNGISTTTTTTATTNGKRTTRRKSYDIAASPPAPPHTRGKRARTESRARRRSPTEEMALDDDDDDDDDDEVAEDIRDTNSGTKRTSKKPETEEEKRKNFLERNRQAALKCRQRKKAWLASLQAKVEFLTNENERLTSALVSSREEISRLSTLVGSAAVGPDHGSMSVHPGGASGAQPVSMNVSLPSKAVAVAASGGRSGYGY